jgi:hypothetical protein
LREVGRGRFHSRINAHDEPRAGTVLAVGPSRRHLVRAGATMDPFRGDAACFGATAAIGLAERLGCGRRVAHVPHEPVQPRVVARAKLCGGRIQ